MSFSYFEPADEDKGEYIGSFKEKNKGGYISVIDFYENEYEEIRYCSHCSEYGFEHKLGAKIKKKGEPVAPDDEQFLSCYQCGRTFPIYETHIESKIKDSVQTTSNPFENESIFLSTDSRKEQRRKGKKRKGRFSYKQEHEDPEIQAEVDRGAIVNILYDSTDSTR